MHKSFTGHTSDFEKGLREERRFCVSRFFVSTTHRSYGKLSQSECLKVLSLSRTHVADNIILVKWQ